MPHADLHAVPDRPGSRDPATVGRVGDHSGGDAPRGCLYALAGGVLLWLLTVALAVYLTVHH